MSDENDYEEIVSSALSSIEGIQCLDEDTVEYVSGMLSEDPFDEDARSAVRELLVDALSQEDNGDLDVVGVCDSLFALLDLNQDANGNATNNATSDNNDNGNGNRDSDPSMRKLSQTITMKEQDVQTFASGLRVQDNEMGETYGQRPITMGGDDEEGPSKIASFFANMIDLGAM